MKLKAACLSALLVATGSLPAIAGPIVDAATQAEALQAEGKTVEALDALDAAVAAAWDASPLAFRKVAIVESVAGVGDYTESTDTTFKPDEKMKIYVEPVGFGYGTSGSQSTIGFKTDLAIENATGQVLGEAKDVFSVTQPVTPNARRFQMTLSYTVPFLRPGAYKAVFTVRDQNSTKTGSFDIPFSIELPTAN